MNHLAPQRTFAEATAAWKRYHDEGLPGESWDAFLRRTSPLEPWDEFVRRTVPTASIAFSWSLVARRTAKWMAVLWGIVVVWASLDNGASLSRTVTIATHPAWLIGLAGVFAFCAIAGGYRTGATKREAESLAYRHWAESSWDKLTDLQREDVKRRFFPVPECQPNLTTALIIANSIAEGRHHY
jgi:hypothetical protein